MTRSRTRILSALHTATAPCSAADMAAMIDHACNQATVYRTLQWLEGEGHAESFVLHCSEHGTERYYVAVKTPHRHWFHCESCHRFIDAGPCDMEQTETRLAGEFGFQLRRHTLYFSGLCADCR